MESPTAKPLAFCLAVAIVGIGVLQRNVWILWFGVGAVWVVRFQLDRKPEERLSRRLWGWGWSIVLAIFVVSSVAW